MYVISRQFEIAIAHRVYNQQEDGFEAKCRRIHGHNVIITVYLASYELNNDMVLDFNVVKKVIGDFLDEFFDHRFIISIHDKELLDLCKLLVEQFGVCSVKTLNGEYDNVYFGSIIKDLVKNEKVVKIQHPNNCFLNSLTLIDTNVTSECLSDLLSHVLSNLLSNYNVIVLAVEIQETSKSKAVAL